MITELQEQLANDFAEYATVPIAFEVREILSVVTPDCGLGGVQLVLRNVAVPYVKDYDADRANHPTGWRSRFDMTNWGTLAARAGGLRVGGAVIAWRSLTVDMLDGREDLAVLWDIRVAPRSRGQGVGAGLFQAAERWAVTRGASWLKVETQNINVPACRFYASQGCVLGGVHRFAYGPLSDEVQLLWYKKLARGTG